MKKKERNIVVIIDYAHGNDVEGKQSPDGSHKEWEWSREVGKMLSQRLQKEGYIVHYSNPLDFEIGLSKRKSFATNLEIPSGKVKFLLSLHNNAAGSDNKWHDASGVEIFTSPGQTISDKFAEEIMNQLEARFPNLKYRVDTTDGDKDKEARFTVLMGAGYYACLLEFLFQDNKKDVKLLKSPQVKNSLVLALVRAINNMDNTF